MINQKVLSWANPTEINRSCTIALPLYFNNRLFHIHGRNKLLFSFQTKNCAIETQEEAKVPILSQQMVRKTLIFTNTVVLIATLLSQQVALFYKEL